MCGVQVEGMQLVIDDLVGSTGLELKVDPGVPYVYAGFAGNPQVLCIHSPSSARYTCDKVRREVRWQAPLHQCSSTVPP